MVILLKIGILRDRVSNTPTSIYKIQNRARVTPWWGREKIEIFLKQRKRNRLSAVETSTFCPSKCRQWRVYTCTCHNVDNVFIDFK